MYQLFHTTLKAKTDAMTQMEDKSRVNLKCILNIRVKRKHAKNNIDSVVNTTMQHQSVSQSRTTHSLVK